MNRKWEIADGTRKPYAVRAVLLRVLHRSLFLHYYYHCRSCHFEEGAATSDVCGGEGAACQEINPIQDYDNENIGGTTDVTEHAAGTRQW